jgi:hypothetical protein
MCVYTHINKANSYGVRPASVIFISSCFHCLKLCDFSKFCPIFLISVVEPNPQEDPDQLFCVAVMRCDSGMETARAGDVQNNVTN